MAKHNLGKKLKEYEATYYNSKGEIAFRRFNAYNDSGAISKALQRINESQKRTFEVTEGKTELQLDLGVTVLVNLVQVVQLEKRIIFPPQNESK
jgi:hypothetical protein